MLSLPPPALVEVGGSCSHHTPITHASGRHHVGGEGRQDGGQGRECRSQEK